MKFIIKSVLLLIALHALVFVAFTVKAEVIKENYTNEEGLKCTIRNTSPEFVYHYLPAKKIMPIAKKKTKAKGRKRGDQSYAHDDFTILYKTGKCDVYIDSTLTEAKQKDAKEHGEKHCTCGNFHKEEGLY